VAVEIATIERLFELAADDPAIYPIWKGLVITHRALGTQVYDARLVAAMLAHGINRILTFNGADFSRYGITVLHPAAMP
jgi:predicted nucleic acid-binding protein